MNVEIGRRWGSIGEGTTTAGTAIWLEHVFSKSMLYFLVLVNAIFSTCPINTSAGPVPFDHHKRAHYEPSSDTAAYDDQLQTYLADFGYLPKNNPEISNLRSDVAVSIALSRLQEYAGLNVTGKLDENTKTLIKKKKRCGLSDIPYDGSGGAGRGRNWRQKRYTIFGEKWDKRRLTYKVVKYSRKMDPGRIRRSVYDALKLWSDASSLKFEETADDGADILIEFAEGDHGDSYPFDGQHVVLAHAYFPGSGRGGDVHFDDAEEWTNEPTIRTYTDYSKVNFFTVAAHEFGHSLGLGHSKDRNSLMFAYYQDYSQISQLPYDDAVAVQMLYGVGKIGEPVPPPPTTTETPQTDPPTFATYAPPPSFTTPVPDACHSHIDAVTRIRREVFVFKGSYFWRFDDDGGITSDPVEINRFWNGFPDDVTSVDAVFERSMTDTIIFFKGKHYWEFRANYVLPGYPKHISSLGLPEDVDHIDAAFIWGWSKKPYVFSGNRYWRLNEATLTVDYDYPRYFGVYWKGVPPNVDAVFTDKAGITYFFKDSEVYKFNDDREEVANNYPVKISEFWAQCRATSKSHQLPYSHIRITANGSSSRSVWSDAGKLLFFILFLFKLRSEL